jgi:hypothetical protein
MLDRLLAAALLMLGAWVGALGCSGDEARDARTETHSETTAPFEPDPLAELRTRPLDLPVLREDGSCPLGDTRVSNATHFSRIPAQAALGNGPVYPAFAGIPRVVDLFPSSEPDWHEATMLWVSMRNYDGAVLVRGGQLDGPNRLGFGVGAAPDWELRLPAGRWQETREPFRIWDQIVRPAKGWRLQAERLRIRARGCYAFQVDGESFSERIVFSAVLQSGRATDY